MKKTLVLNKSLVAEQEFGGRVAKKTMVSEEERR
jgi:hypothetical protein